MKKLEKEITNLKNKITNLENKVKDRDSQLEKMRQKEQLMAGTKTINEPELLIKMELPKNFIEYKLYNQSNTLEVLEDGTGAKVKPNRSWFGLKMAFKKPIMANKITFKRKFILKEKPENKTEEEWKKECENFLKNNQHYD